MEIDVTRDQARLKKAALELLEQGFASSRSFRSLELMDESTKERIAASLPPLTLSPGYYKRAQFLFWLENYKKTGLATGEYALAEADGLMAVAEARAEFERNHPPCGVCSALQESPFATSCCRCGTEFLKRSA